MDATITMKDPAPSDVRPRERGRSFDLTKGPITRTLLWFMLPTLGSSILQSLNGSINSIWIGRMLGEEALAATSNASTVMFLLQAFVFGVGMAATILIGQAVGRKNVDEARRVLGSAFTTFGILCTLMCVVGYYASPAILHMLDTPPSAMPLAIIYLKTIFLGLPASLLLTMMMMAMRGTGDSMTPLFFMGVSVVLDSGLNPFFIAGIGPFPHWGIAGSAVATLIANWVALFALIITIYVRDLPLRLRGRELRYLIPQKTLVKTLIVKGLPMGLQMIAVSASAMTMYGMINREGVNTVAAFGVAMQLWSYVQMPAMAVGSAVSTMVAQNIGANQWGRVTQITKSGIWIVLAVTGAMVLGLALADRPVLELFLGSNSPAEPIATHIQLLGTWGYLPFAVAFVLFGTVRANGAVVPPLVILAIGLLPVRLCFAYSGQRLIGTDALWLSLPVASLFNMTMAILYYRRGSWKKAQMQVGIPVPAPATA